MQQAAVIVGATGGIGSALVDAVMASGKFTAVHAISRQAYAAGAGVTAHRADVTDEPSIERVAGVVGTGAPVGLIIVASGLLHAADIAPEKSLRAIDPASLAKLFAVNAVGPAIVAKHLVPLMPKTGRSVFAAISARVGSIEDNRLGGWYGYRASKAALNQLVRTLAVELRRIRPDAIAIALHPGTVITGLSEPFRSDVSKPGTFRPVDAAANLAGVIERATPEQSGQFLAWDGSRIPF